MELQTNAFLKAIAALTANQVAAAAVEALPDAQVVPMAQNTQKLSLTTPVLFYGRFKDGKSIPPNAFLMELKARQTRHGWEPSMLLRFVKSCLRGGAAL
jgi:CheY-specific phosphatase CheX